MVVLLLAVVAVVVVVCGGDDCGGVCECAVANPVLNWVSHSCVCSPYIRWW